MNDPLESKRPREPFNLKLVYAETVPLWEQCSASCTVGFHRDDDCPHVWSEDYEVYRCEDGMLLYARMTEADDWHDDPSFRMVVLNRRTESRGYDTEAEAWAQLQTAVDQGLGPASDVQNARKQLREAEADQRRRTGLLQALQTRIATERGPSATKESHEQQ